jgi:hypothetical protein
MMGRSVPARLRELAALGQTLTRRAADVLVYFGRPRTFNGHLLEILATGPPGSGVIRRGGGRPGRTAPAMYRACTCHVPEQVSALINLPRSSGRAGGGDHPSRIVVLLALTVRALDPAENEAVRTEYRRRVLAHGVHRELRARASLSVTSVLNRNGVIEFSPAFLWPGGKVITGRGGSRVARNVFVWRLRLLGWHAGLSRPVLRMWPGRVASTR